jgi:selT/selW/selH-like putative selenoprotein
LAEKIKETYSLETELDRQAGGVFDVFAGDDLIFSKHSEGRFPENDEIIDRLKKKLE